MQLRQFLLELVVDARNHVEILGLAFGNIVELLLKGARVVVLKKGEVAFERVDEQDAEVRGPQYLFGIVDVVAGDDVLKDRRVGRGPSDSFMFQLLDKACLGVAVRRARLLVQHTGAVGMKLGAASKCGNAAILVRLFLRVLSVVRIGFFGGILGSQSAPAGLDEGSAHSFEDEGLGTILGSKRESVHAVFSIRKL